MRNITGKSCILTGASRGIGKTLAERLAAEGVLVTAVARDAELLEALCSENEGITACACDVTDEEGVRNLTAGHIE
ncbi:MAG: SDR family NAD(P)-dependent oxidoreductase, partial [Planctomycetota bacterium]|nr:SDR family NAD(P)-dependent oxidoreductase [Planctomycetota bacterium]